MVICGYALIYALMMIVSVIVMQLASVTVLGHGVGKLGNEPEFVRDVLTKFKDFYDRERRAFVKSNERETAKLEAFLEERYGTLSKYPIIRDAQLKRYRGFMSADLKAIKPYGMLDQNL